MMRWGKMYNQYKHGKLSENVRGIILNQSKGDSERRVDFSNTENEMKNKKTFIYTEVLNISKRYERIAIASDANGKPETPENVRRLIEDYKRDLRDILPLAETDVEKAISEEIKASGFFEKEVRNREDIANLSAEIQTLIKKVQLNT